MFLLTVVLSLTKSFYVKFSLQSKVSESQYRFYKIVLELAFRDRSLTVSLVSQLGETS